MAKKQFVREMFDNISPTYDKLNHLLSMNIDRSWRRKAVAQLCADCPQRVLDVACGTGDFAVALAEAGVPRVDGVDISEGMLQVGREKVERLGLSNQIVLGVDDSEHLSFDDATFDGISVAFGVRNFEHIATGLAQMCRVLKSGGRLLVLELSVPSNPVLLWAYKLYFLHLLPWVGGLVSGHPEAYRYLPASVLRFPKPDVFLRMMEDAGFVQCRQQALTFGLCRIYTGQKL